MISLNNTQELRFWECAQGFNITDCVCPIGHYSTKAKAMKVLDMIQEAYANVELIPMAVQNIGKMFQKAIGKAIMNKMIFQMPEEGSV